ncbi:MAG: DUF2334 domain-containing protein [Bacteroidetes bacterium]|nr:DUF2334 domain-containing protein [Bacteroidota bacterium]
MSQFIIRLDDACPAMDHKKWRAYFDLLDRYNVKPIVAVIPDNKDPKLNIDAPDPNFWQEVKDWQRKGYCIAMHGYDHVYISKNGGLLKINNRSEFAGVPYDQQKIKLEKAQEIFENNGIHPEVFVAPAHTFDRNTLKALKSVTTVKTISDGYAMKAYNSMGFNWIPQQLWGPKKKSFGLWTICYHPNTSNEKEMAILETFLKEHSKAVVTPAQLKFRRQGILDHGYRNYFHLKKKILSIIRR